MEKINENYFSNEAPLIISISTSRKTNNFLTLFL